MSESGGLRQKFGGFHGGSSWFVWVAAYGAAVWQWSEIAVAGVPVWSGAAINHRRWRMRWFWWCDGVSGRLVSELKRDLSREDGGWYGGEQIPMPTKGPCGGSGVADRSGSSQKGWVITTSAGRRFDGDGDRPATEGWRRCGGFDGGEVMQRLMWARVGWPVDLSLALDLMSLIWATDPILVFPMVLMKSFILLVLYCLVVVGFSSFWFWLGLISLSSFERGLGCFGLVGVLLW